MTGRCADVVRQVFGEKHGVRYLPRELPARATVERRTVRVACDDHTQGRRRSRQRRRRRVSGGRRFGVFKQIHYVV